MSGNATTPTPTIPGIPPAIASLLPPGTQLPPGVTFSPDEPPAYILTLLQILQHAQDFTLFYVALSRKMAEAQSREEGAEEESEDTVDAHSSVSGSALRDTKGEAVAKGVVAFLRRLRDDS